MENLNISKRDYLARIAPNFSILDTVESYITHGTDLSENSLFLYVPENVGEYTTKFYRGLFEIESPSENIFENAIYEKYLYGDKVVYIAVSNNNKQLKIINYTKIIGVGF